MPLTRKQQFHIAIETYVNEYLSTYSDENIVQGFRWAITDTSPNNSSALHTYEITIPNRVRIPLNELDTYMTVTQRIPTPDQFQEHLNQYFLPFTMFCTWSGEKAAYVEMTNTTFINETLTGNIKVVYKPRHFPYPVKKTHLEQLREHCEELEHECETNRSVIQVQKKTLKKLRVKMRRYQERMQQIVRDGYETIEKYTHGKEQCPVCISDIIAKENLMVPLCGHYICSDCMPKCERCPICRDVYIRPVPTMLDGTHS